MEKKNDQIFGFDYPDLDLSDEQQQKKQAGQKEPSGDPSKKTKIDESIQKTNQAQNKTSNPQRGSFGQNQAPKIGMGFFPPPPGGAQSSKSSGWVPPPPVVQKSSQSQQNTPRPQFQKQQYNQSRDSRQNRQKKNIVYVKNITKSFNTPQKLMTFFKNQGVIKQIRVNDVQQSAVIKFLKQQNATKFIKSNKIIFNRSYIVYSDRQNLPLTQQQITDRVNDEQGNVKKAEQNNLKVMKQKVHNQLSQHIRALYFFQNHLEQAQQQQTGSLTNQVRKQLGKKIQNKKILQNQGEQVTKPEQFSSNYYNWTLSLTRKSALPIDKRSLFTEFLKYGPIINLEFQCISQTKPQVQAPQNKPEIQGQQKGKEQPSETIFNYEIKILFMSLKHCWTLYNAKKQQMGLSVQGDQIRNFFDSGKLKPIQLKKATPQTETGSQNLVNENKKIHQIILKPEEPSKPQPINLQLGNDGQVTKQ